MSPPHWAYQTELFSPSPDEELVCSICHNVFCEPLQCPCRHVFCRVCIDKWLHGNNSCPVCRKRVTLRQLQDVVPIVQNMILKLTLHCHNQDNGCEAVQTLEQMETHVKMCPNEIVYCKNDSCQVRMPRKDIAKHEEAECTLRYVKCERCRAKMPVGNSTTEHNCLKELLATLKKKNSSIKMKNRKIKELLAENYKLKQAAQDRENDLSDSSFSADLLGSDISDLSGSSTDYNVNWEPSSNSDFSVELDDTLSDIEQQEINIAIERSRNDSSVIEINSTFETSDLQNTSDCVEVPRASTNSSDFHVDNNGDSETLDATVPFPRDGDVDSSPEIAHSRPTKRRHAPQPLSSDDESAEDSALLNSGGTSWTPAVKYLLPLPFNRPNHTLRLGSEPNVTPLSAGQSSSSGSSGASVPNEKRSSCRKRYRRNSVAEDEEHYLRGPNSETEPVCHLLAERNRRRAFERTINLLESYNLESDPEWVPPTDRVRVESDSDNSTDSASLHDNSSPSSDDEESSGSEQEPPTSVLLNRDLNLFANSDESEDPDWIP